MLVDALRSALEQHYPAIEAWVVDDGSVPPIRLPERFALDGRVHLVRVERSIGTAAARNLAVDRCAGTFIGFLDDDDEWLPSKTQKQVSALLDAPDDVAAVQSGWEFWDESGVLFRFLPDPDRDLRRLVLERPVMAPTSVLMRRDAFRALGGFDPTIDRGEDWELWVRLSDRYRVAVIREVHARRRAHPQRLLAPRELPARKDMLRRLGPRLARLPDSERRRAEAAHLAVIGRNEAQLGERRQALRTLGRALVRSPGHATLYLSVVEAVLSGTPLWRLAREARRRLHRLGRKPQVRSW